jgi:hypothetical protein
VDDKWVYGVDGKEEVEILEEPYDVSYSILFFAK